MVSETVDSILVKEGICLISQCCFYQHSMIPHTLNIYGFLLVLRSLSWKKNRLRPKKALNPCTLLASF